MDIFLSLTAMIGHSGWYTHWVVAETKVDVGNSNLILVQPHRTSPGTDKILDHRDNDHLV